MKWLLPTFIYFFSPAFFPSRCSEISGNLKKQDCLCVNFLLMSKTHHVIAMYWRRQQYVFGGCLICPGSFEQMFSDSLSKTEESSPEREGDGPPLSLLHPVLVPWEGVRQSHVHAAQSVLASGRWSTWVASIPGWAAKGGVQACPPIYQTKHQSLDQNKPYSSIAVVAPRSLFGQTRAEGGPASNRGWWVRCPGPPRLCGTG